MYRHQSFKPLSPPTAENQRLAYFLVILLISACGGEETANRPMIETVEGETFSTSRLNYFPLTVGNRWVYRNPDGTEWTREITNAKVIGDLRYHLSRHNPANNARLDFLKNPAYAATPHRFVLLVKDNGVRDAVQQAILRSGGENPNWKLSHTFDGRTWQTQKNESALVYLFHYRTSMVSHHELLTLLRFPLVPGQIYNSLNLNLSGSNETASEFHAFEASGVISGEVGHPESVHTPAGTFEGCLKIQYQAKVLSFETTEFRNMLPQPPPTKELESYLRLLESDIREELANLMISVMSELGFETVWLAPGVGPVKIETPNGIAELIDYEVKAVASGQ